MEKEGRMTCHVLLKLGASRKEEGKKPRQNQSSDLLVGKGNWDHSDLFMDGLKPAYLP